MIPTSIKCSRRDELPVGVVGFDDRENIYKTFTIGFEDARRGFVPYRYGEDSDFLRQS